VTRAPDGDSPDGRFPDGHSPDADAFVAALIADPVAAFDAYGPLVPEMARMEDCPQPANHHSEGTVWSHARLALLMLVDLQRWIAHFAEGSLKAVGRWPLDFPARTLTQTLAVMLHDVGKPPTRAGRDGAWTYYGHDAVGARIAVDIIERLGLREAVRRQGAELDTDDLAWLIANHLFWLNTEVERVTDRAVSRRYTDDWRRGDDLRVLSWADTLGSRNPQDQPHVELMVAAEQRLHATRMRSRVPPERPAVRGDVVIRELDVQPGPRVGAVLEWLTKKGLTDADAVAALRDNREHLRTVAPETLRASATEDQ
jgi:hypothetical protein